MVKSLDKWQFGDFQTPESLARLSMKLLKDKHHLEPDSIIEPSCGEGAFVEAAAYEYSDASILGVDINPNYSAKAQERTSFSNNTKILCSNFFTTDWAHELEEYAGKLLITGNPPWVTASELSLLNSQNLPHKHNFQNKKGIDAITGSSNFDISEWMLLQYLDWIENREGYVAILCKASVARKVFRNIATTKNFGHECHIYNIDAQKEFSASVEACFFVILPSDSESKCFLHDSIYSSKPANSIGVRHGELINNIENFDKWQKLRGQDLRFVWRSGIKHDCSKVMELDSSNGFLKNGFGEDIDIERKYVYPLLKGSDVANGRIATSRKSVIVTQTYVGESTDNIASIAPKTWNYLNSHKMKLNSRTSSIYRGKPQFSIFGIGEYSFSNWKIAISGMYKRLEFQLLTPLNGKPVMVDDTVYFISCDSLKQAQFIFKLLCSKPAIEFLNSLIFGTKSDQLLQGYCVN